MRDAKRSVDGKPAEERKRRWLAVAQPLYRRCRAEFTGKAKRMTIETGELGLKDKRELRRSTATV